MMELYQFEECPYCTMVRKWLSAHEITYINHNIDRMDRTEVVKISGQETVPVLVDGKTVISDENEIIAYLKKKFK